MRIASHRIAPGRALREDGCRRAARTPAHIPLIGWKDILLRVFHAFCDNDLSIIAAGVSFDGLLAIFPVHAAFVAVYGLFQDSHNVVSQMQGLSGILPPDLVNTVTDPMIQIAGRPAGSLGLAALLLALWSARKGANGLIVALNGVYAEKESRNLIITTLVSLALPLVIIVGLVGIAVLAAGVPLVAPAIGCNSGMVAIARGMGLGADALLLMLGIAGCIGSRPAEHGRNGVG